MGATFATDTPAFSIGEFLDEERGKDLLRFSTAGSVDDGKSTLIGRLLYDTQSVYEDQVRSIEGKGTTAPGQIDFALLTDGLRAEREQGITIDVAYRYFSTARRKFIIADTPGHEQYTRNMATGASTADAAVVLIDAGKGVLPQSRRHAYIASLLRVRHVLVAVNKMDLIGYDEERFRAIERDFRAVLDQIAKDTDSPVEAHFLPVSALKGDNIVRRSEVMDWYNGPSLLELLETVPAGAGSESVDAPFRFPVQRVLRPDHTFRGFSGQIASGTIKPGDRITALPSGHSAEVARIVTYDGDLDVAEAPLSVTLVLNHELDISRGDLIVASAAPAPVARACKAHLVWMDQKPLERNRRYLLKLASHTVPAVVTRLDYRTDIGTLQHEPAQTLEMNGIGVVEIHLVRPIALDLYRNNRGTGAFILIDPVTNSTAAAGMVREVLTPAGETAATVGAVTANERVQRWGHRGGVVELEGSNALIDAVERAVFTAGGVTVRVEAEHDAELVAAAGVLALKIIPHSDEEDGLLTATARGEVVSVDAEAGDAVAEVMLLLRRVGILVPREDEDFTI